MAESMFHVGQYPTRLIGFVNHFKPGFAGIRSIEDMSKCVLPAHKKRSGFTSTLNLKRMQDSIAQHSTGV